MFNLCRRITIFSLVSACLVSCGMGQTQGRRAVKYVEDILSDPGSWPYSLVEDFDSRNTHADIVIIDSPERCFRLSERMLTYDRHDNYDASLRPDHLPDFSGERITSIIDVTNTPYDRFISAGNPDALREVTVRSVLSALDTLYRTDESDHEVRGRKQSAKILVISSPYMAAHGQFDVDTLFSTIGADIPVVCASREVVNNVLSSRKGAVIMGFLSDSLTMSSAIYGEVFNDVATARGDKMSRCVQVPFDGSRDPLRAFLDGYSRSGVNSPLSVLAVDDPSVRADSLRAVLSDIQAGTSEESAFYRRMLAKDFEILDCGDIVTETCYRILRERNLFTHNISYPAAGSFLTSAEEEGCSLVSFDVKALPDSLMKIMAAAAPKTTRMYVQDQHNTRGN